MSNSTETLNDIFRILWANSLVNVNVLCQDEHTFWSFYTFMPYQNDCFTLSHFKTASFTPQNFTNNMKLSIIEVFPPKLNNFNNCTLLVAPSTVDPFVIQGNNTTDENSHYRGIDIEIIKQISKAQNFNIQYVQSQDRTGHGVIFRNGTVTGNLELVCNSHNISILLKFLFILFLI